MSSSGFPYAESLTQEYQDRLVQLDKECTSLDDLWAVYGTSLVGHGATGEPPIEPGKKSFNKILGELKKTLCNDAKIKKFVHDSEVDDFLSLAMIYTAKLASEHFAGVDVCAIGFLVARIGLRRLCEAEHIE